MKIIALVENISDGSVKAKHGLSFYIETNKHKILFDVGPDKTLFENAKRKKIDLTKVDTVIISHGHKDHGGALKKFMEINKNARIYLQKSAFDKHLVKVLFLKIGISLDKRLMNDQRIVLIDGDHRIDDELMLFTANSNDSFHSQANMNLYAGKQLDDFRHEHNLLIHENKNVVFMGCGHSGVIRILKSSSEIRPDYCIGGFHLFDPVSKKTVPKAQLDELSEALEQFNDVKFYTCHCTGTDAYRYLKDRHKNISYFKCGRQLEI
ncbi:MAG: MBL fold metallo-hydrolase [Ruminococcus sp.]|nr:MBL fold metallo-hydrolase [Ruminococcus sp.]